MIVKPVQHDIPPGWHANVPAPYPRDYKRHIAALTHWLMQTFACSKGAQRAWTHHPATEQEVEDYERITMLDGGYAGKGFPTVEENAFVDAFIKRDRAVYLVLGAAVQGGVEQEASLCAALRQRIEHALQMVPEARGTALYWRRHLELSITPASEVDFATRTAMHTPARVDLTMRVAIPALREYFNSSGLFNTGCWSAKV